MTPGLVIFDIGATLVEGPATGPAAQLAEAARLDRDATLALQRELMIKSLAGSGEVVGLVRELGGAGDRLETVTQDLWRRQARAARAIAGAAGVLYSLREAGIQLALISNIWPPYLKSVRAQLGGAFDVCVAPELAFFSCEQGLAKPDPALFTSALVAAGIEPAEAVMVGDSYKEDIAPATDLGLATVWVLHRPEREAQELARVVRGEAPAPTCAVASVVEVTPELVAPLVGAPKAVHA